MSGRKFNIVFIALVLLQAGLLLYIVAYRQHWADTGVKVIVKAAPVDPRVLMRGDYVRLGYGFSRMVVPESINEEELHKGQEVYVTLKDSGIGGIYVGGELMENMPSSEIGMPFVQGRIDGLDSRTESNVVTIELDGGAQRTFKLDVMDGGLSTGTIGHIHGFCLHGDVASTYHVHVEKEGKGYKIDPTFCKDGKLVIGKIMDFTTQYEYTARIEYGIDAYYVAEGTGYALERTRDKGGLDVELSLRPDGKALITAIIVNGTRIE